MAIKKVSTSKKPIKCSIPLKGVDCDLKAWFEQEAQTNDRSLTKEIIQAMRKYKKENEQ